MAEVSDEEQARILFNDLGYRHPSDLDYLLVLNAFAAAHAEGVREGLGQAAAHIRETEAKVPLKWRAHLDYAAALERLAQEGAGR